MGLSVASGLVVDKTTELPKTLSEYYGYGGSASKIFFKAGGVVGIGMALNDIQKDSRLYSGWNRYKVITADLAPVIFGTALGEYWWGYIWNAGCVWACWRCDWRLYERIYKKQRRLLIKKRKLESITRR